MMDSAALRMFATVLGNAITWFRKAALSVANVLQTETANPARIATSATLVIRRMPILPNLTARIAMLMAKTGCAMAAERVGRGRQVNA